MSCFHCISKPFAYVAKFCGLELFEEYIESNWKSSFWKFYGNLCLYGMFISMLMDGVLLLLPMDLINQLTFGTLVAFNEGIKHRLCEDLSFFLNVSWCILIYNSKRYKKMMRKFIQLWKITKSATYEKELENDLQYWQNYIFSRICVITFIVSILNILLVFSQKMVSLFYGSKTHVMTVFFLLVIFLVRLAFSVIVLSMSLGFFIYICVAIRLKFKYLHEEIMEFKKHKIKIKNGLKPLQIRHYFLTEMVLIVDSCFSSLIFATIGCSIFYICTSAYPILFIKTDIYINVMLFNWTIFGLLSLIITSLIASFIIDEAHNPYKTIIQLNSKELSHDLKLKLQIFLKRLSGPKIGISCLDIYVVNRGSVFNILNSLITYFLILIQVQQMKITNTKDRK
ncbi:gustatory receptor family protein 3-like [Centruroides vittatus]|uniref:gustatory receptor family protein 3-like n=1 Tax=Centruroides vittatus TaxID=120091 RepID=UPI00350EF515